jgi:2-phospho-L-lactate guanylyltransferase
MWALVPIKSFAEAKQRLSDALAPAERAGLARAMAQDVLAALCACAGLARIVLVSGEPEARTLAQACSVEFLGEPPLRGGGLNATIKHAVEQFRAAGANSIVIVHGDLPMLDSKELERVLEVHRANGEPAVTLVPDRARDGTNVLAWTPLDGFRAQYGPSSFTRHREQALRRGAKLAICESTGASLDIDMPEDLGLLLARAREDQARATRSFLDQAGIAARLVAHGGVAHARSHEWRLN